MDDRAEEKGEVAGNKKKERDTGIRTCRKI
jgi:hypothetical protein